MSARPDEFRNMTMPEVQCQVNSMMTASLIVAPKDTKLILLVMVDNDGVPYMSAGSMQGQITHELAKNLIHFLAENFDKSMQFGG